MKKVFFLLTRIMFALALTGCGSFYNDYSDSLTPNLVFSLETGTYGSIAWLSEDAIAVDIYRDAVYVDNKKCARQEIDIVDIKMNTSQRLNLGLKDDCEVYLLGNLQKLPNGNIGYLFKFPPYDENNFVRQLELNNGEYSLLKEIKIPLDQFSFSPDMRAIAATQVKDITSSKIVLINEKGEETNITPDFARAQMAKWSANNIIAFFGTKTFEKEKEPLIQFYSFEKYLDYPWRLYLYDTNSGNMTELPFEVVDPGALKWSPDLKKVAFRGEIKGIPGIWIINNLDDLENLQIDRIIDAESIFDFSPDGKSMVFAYIGLQNTEKQDSLYLIDLPYDN